ncbi:helix-turn-helix domain-containing protein [Polaribacter sp. R2A056_3_33]|uniref:helix-turn-helix transcriptional regulator n=1 Tax=Polaribacter sp. R2A056_3_33 TaxID=2745563 RepID=UPI001C4E7E6B|nr:helix-turn-helix domain-containing protein [Polaribacter sp. R2A056_3_33]QXP68956.1 helix-turn-helix domain-containing protein [Polaribacter sp. R2A056_3_33]
MKEVQIKTIMVPKEEWDKVVTTLEKMNNNISGLMSKNVKEYLTKKEVMSILKIGRTTLDRYIEEGFLHEVKLGKGTRGYIKQSELDDIMGNV